MGAPGDQSAEAASTGAVAGAVNEVRLQGRVSAPPEERVLPSGDAVLTLRLVVARGRPRPGSRQTVDVLDCAVWTARLRRTVAGWGEGDVVEVRGSVRRRFYRSGSGTASRVEIEVATGRLIRRASTG